MDKKPNNAFFNHILNFLSSLFKRFSKLFDRILFDERGSVIVSLIMAILVCVAIDYDTISIKLFNDTTATVTISDVQVNALYDETLYEISGIPATVDVTLSGETTDIQVFRQQGAITVSADMRKCATGTNIIDLTVDSLPSSLSAKIDPSEVTVNIENKATKQFTVSAELMVGSGQKESDFEAPELATTTVQITGSESNLSSIRSVKALVDTTGQTEDFEVDATVVAYDASGKTLDVTIDPGTIRASVKIATTSE